MNGSESSKQTLSILYVDDEPVLLEAGKLYLEHIGDFNVTTCESASDALELLSASRYDAIISDYQMPECDGISFLNSLRGRGDNTPFIIFTGKGREEVVIEALNSGADFYIQKGGEPKSQFAELTNKIRYAVAQRKGEEALHKSEERYRQLFENMTQGFALHEIITDENKKPVDYRFLAVNPAFEKLTGLKAEEIIGRRVLEVLPETEDYWIETYGDVALTKKTAEFENYSRELDQWYDVFAYSPKTGQFAVTFTDITARKEAEVILKRSEKRYKGIFENANDMIIINEITPDNRPGRIIDANQAAEEILGYSRDELKTLNIRDITCPESSGKSVRIGNDLINSGRSLFEGQMIHKDGRLIPVEVSTNLSGEAGQRISTTIIRNISERTDLLDRLSITIEGGELGTWDWHVRTGKVIFNRRWAEMMGYSPEEIPGDVSSWERLIHPEDHDSVMAVLKGHLEGKNPSYECEYRLIGRDGRVIWILDKGRVAERDINNAPLRMAGTHLDITEKKRAEEELKRKNEELAAAEEELRQQLDEIVQAQEKLEENEDILKEKNSLLSQNAKKLSILNKIITIANQADDLRSLLNNTLNATLSLLEYDAGAIYIVNTETETASIVCSENLPGYILKKSGTVPIRKAPYDTLFMKGNPIITCHYNTLSPEIADETGFITIASIPLLSKGRIIGALNIAGRKMHDIKDDEREILISAGKELGSTVERFAAEDESKKLAANLELLFNSVGEMIVILDMNGRVVRVNNTILSRLGYLESELIGRDATILRPANRMEEVISNIQAMIAGEIDSCMIPVLTKEGKLIEAETTVTRGLWDNNQVLIAVVRDISSRKRAEEAFKIANKKLQLLSGITRHDILNQIMVIEGYLDIADSIEKDPELERYLNNVNQATYSIQRQIEFTREYNELGSEDPFWFNLPPLMEKTGRGNITLICDCKGLFIFADPMIERVLSNLYDNTLRHGKGATGIRVSCRPEEQPEEEPDGGHEKEKKTHGYIIIWEDDGCGVPDDMKEKIFERGVGANTGLGLFLIREILAITGITIRENGVHGKGARFEMTVPDGAWRIEKDINTI
ncbi:PAS domain S-box protein [Methanoplanus endosymbiosus]|uniref:histidine kinase n=1 Tax=Methanoplanus endosymbiosus TaxID=33865 RepID=A0A9E7PNE4_9EURY|nr:PAS domain S-box protein [Methanoplanus endosymbiosus]UUX92507.1 PAS domain S-box protein [Methanoplanus endosymbiosus]